MKTYVPADCKKFMKRYQQGEKRIVGSGKACQTGGSEERVSGSDEQGEEK